MSGVSAIGGLSGASGIQTILALRQQIIDRSQILQQIHAGQPATATPATSSSGAASGFTGALEQALNGVNASQQNADQLSAAYETGQTQDVAKVMMARQQASVGFEATLQVRNKLLSAYQDIMKMGV
ncbi:MAG TPA: flagellar hook-basal body complex protein FliE [Novosphingobium sp.]|nr:flagellar hook-basal body complex protein FliE [Novosphingobium sp.]HZV11095.1 flagellar hook-basal body complex protein FliE [Novosphingobium sp.]